MKNLHENLIKNEIESEISDYYICIGENNKKFIKSMKNDLLNIENYEEID